MEKQDYKIYIIGAGVSGLIAAQTLENQGYSPIILESTDSVGGRVKTDIVEGYQLDHGFQVLLTSYPAAQKFLDYEALELQNFLPGAAIFNNGKENQIGDPLRDFSLLFPTVFSSLIPLSDKIKILQLNLKLKAKSIAEIFNEEEKTTLQYLKDFGFSNQVISQFFKPFFSGIFLETQLETSSRMFEFVYKMFGTGNAALPKAGIQAIPNQLANNLKSTKILFNTKVKSVQDGIINLENGQVLESDFTIIATDASHLIPDFKREMLIWKSCFNLYFETEKRVIQKPLIGLLPAENTVINNIFYHTSLETSVNAGKELLSVTVVDHQNLKGQELVDQVKGELKKHFNIDVIRLIKQYEIPQALPDLKNIKYNLIPSESRYSNQIFLAGDTLVNGSLNAAMLSGESAAFAVIEALGKIGK
ncbi:NAD(P)/FAD-dependent oxidoreductase [Kaistella antarctica]|uniref:Oxidoreductase n=1 Tax=Kaistella antarctica TaxID=266748 RepID=A0A3S4W1N1_9FLAO|nr:NAD(P)/FAD-dependent oxidoreductase [Kaistella antarctica]KEY19740.1 oxidoreductase [Kaistella antarctica]SEV98350.1 Flavin containing amine oxidoreductase [Kaistella antarctica]VEH96607.1 protoporphyrinogen oxidase [Kaistella antarctica]